MDRQRSPNMSQGQLSNKSPQSRSQRNINFAPNSQNNLTKRSRMKNHSTCSLFEECKTNDFKKVHLSKRKKRSKPQTRRPIILINKFHLSLANYIQEHKSAIKLCGTKRFCDKTGEYYLNNVQLEQNPNFEESAILPTLSLREPTNLLNCIIRSNGLRNLRSKASEIITKIPDNSLTPIPTMSKMEIKNKYEGKRLSNAERTAVHIRRLEYSDCFQRRDRKTASSTMPSIILIQQWWKMMYSIIRIQKFYKGRYFRKKLLDTLNIEESELEKIFYLESICDRLFIRRSLYVMFESVGMGESLPIRNATALSRISIMKSILRKMLYRWKRMTGLRCGNDERGKSDRHCSNNDKGDGNEDEGYYLTNNDIDNSNSNKKVIKRLVWYKNNMHLLPLFKKGNWHLYKSIESYFFNKLKLATPYLNYMSNSKTSKTKFQRKRHPSLKSIQLLSDNNNNNYNSSNNNNSNSYSYNLTNENMITQGKRITTSSMSNPTAILDKYFGQWVDYLNNKAEVNRIVSSLAYMISSQSASKGILTQRIHFGSASINNTNRSFRNSHNNNNNDNIQKRNYNNNDTHTLAQEKNRLDNNFIYYKKSPSMPSHQDDSNERFSIHSNSFLDKNANKIISEDGIMIDPKLGRSVLKTGSNQIMQSIGDDCLEVKAFLTRSTIDKEIKETQTEPVAMVNKCVGPGGEDKGEILRLLIKKRLLRCYFVKMCALDPELLSIRTNNLLIRKHQQNKYVNAKELFTQLGMKKFYFDHWKYLHEKNIVLKSVINKGDVIAKNCEINHKALKIKDFIQKQGLCGATYVKHDAKSNRDQNKEIDQYNNSNAHSATITDSQTKLKRVQYTQLRAYFNQWKSATQNQMQYELLLFELLRVVSAHHKKAFLSRLNKTPYIPNAKKNKINSMTNHKQMRLKIEEEIKNKKLPLNKRDNFRFLHKANNIQHTTASYEETKAKGKNKYGLHTLPHSHSPFQKIDDQYEDNGVLLRNKTANGMYYNKREALSSSKINLSKIDKEILNKELEQQSYDLIPDNKTTFAPTIYASQSFLLKKDTYAPDPHTSKLHSDFMSLFDNTEPVVDDCDVQRIQVTRATVLAVDDNTNNNSNNKEANDENNTNANKEDVLKKKVIERCSKDIDKRDKFYTNDELKSPLKSKSKSKAKTPEQYYALPFNDSLREQLNVVNDEDLQQFALINHGKINSISSNTLIKPQASPSSNELQLTNPLFPKVNTSKKKRRTNSCTQLPQKEKVFQLTEMNVAQFYHTPIKESSQTQHESSLGTIGMYTNVSKSTRRGKKPSFKKKTMDCSILSSSLLSTIQQEKPSNSAKEFNMNQPQYRYKSNMIKPLKPTSLYNTEQLGYPTQYDQMNTNKMYLQQQQQRQYFPPSPYDNMYLSQSNQLNRIESKPVQYHHHQSHPVFYNQNQNLMDNNNDLITSNNSKQFMTSNTLQSKPIQFQSPNRDNNTIQSTYHNNFNNGNNSIIYRSGDSYYDYHIEKEFFNKPYYKLFIHKLLFEAKSFRKKDNLHYLIKITFHFKRLAQISSLKQLIANWHKMSGIGNKCQT